MLQDYNRKFAMINFLHHIAGIPGDGRCLFRAVVYGACLRSGEPSPSLSRQRELADELRAKVLFSPSSTYNLQIDSDYFSAQIYDHVYPP